MDLEILDLGRDVGRAIRSIRSSADLTQAELADRLATTQSAVSRWERGHDEPRLSTFAAIVRACGYSASIAVRDDVDRAQIREHLAMSPADRLRSVANVSQFRSLATEVGTP